MAFLTLNQLILWGRVKQPKNKTLSIILNAFINERRTFNMQTIFTQELKVTEQVI